MFQLEKDLHNYVQYSLGFMARKNLKPGVVPSHFHCQPDWRPRESVERVTSVGRKRKAVVADVLAQEIMKCDVPSEEAEMNEFPPQNECIEGE